MKKKGKKLKKYLKKIEKKSFSLKKITESTQLRAIVFIFFYDVTKGLDRITRKITYKC